MATKKRTSSASTSRSNSYANLLRRIEAQQETIKQLTLDVELVDVGRRNLMKELQNRDQQASARPFREILVSVKDKEGRLTSTQTVHMNKGDRVEFGVSPEGYVTTKADRDTK